MGQHTSRVGQRVDKTEVNDHQQVRYYATGQPVLLSSRTGKVIEKSVHRETLTCPKCREAGYYDENATPLCPECGLVLTGRDGAGIDSRTAGGDMVIADAKSAGRVVSDS